MENNIKYRPINDTDREFLYRVYASTRESEMDLLDWDSNEKEAFLRGQFTAQHQQYQEYFASAGFYIITLNDVPAGRLYIDYRKDAIHIIDIALLPEYRGKGVGTSILRGILNEGRASGLPVRIHVEQFNPAMSLYKRLGFRKTAETGLYDLMEWKPEKSE